MPLPRSYLYLPGHRQDFLDKALARGADALIIDLEDAVPMNDKPEARVLVREWLSSQPITPEAEVWVRTNPVPAVTEDLRALADMPIVTGFCLAKTESVSDVCTVSGLLDDAGSAARVMPLLESAAAVHAVRDIARGPRVSRLQLGEADLAVDVGIDPDDYGTEFASAHAEVAFASAAAGISAPVAAVSTNFRDADMFRASSEALRRRGFFGRACIHPAQVPIANDVFTIPAERAEWARQVLAAQEHHHGAAAFLGPDGRMVDEAVLRAARRILAQIRS